MNAIQLDLPRIAIACKANDVKRLEVFGSLSREDATPSSDVDFIVEFVDPLRPGVFDRYLALRLALQSITGREVDLVECSAIQNRILQQRIAADRKIIYAA